MPQHIVYLNKNDGPVTLFLIINFKEKPVKDEKGDYYDEVKIYLQKVIENYKKL